MSRYDLPQFLTLDTVAEALNMRVSEVTELLESGELLGIRIGSTRSWRVEITQLELFVQHAYELQSQAAKWQSSGFANIPELSDGRII